MVYQKSCVTLLVHASNDAIVQFYTSMPPDWVFVESKFVVQIGKSQRVKGADYAFESIHNIKEAIPELRESDMKSEVGYPGKVAVETSVTA